MVTDEKIDSKSQTTGAQDVGSAQPEQHHPTLAAGEQIKTESVEAKTDAQLKREQIKADVGKLLDDLARYEIPPHAMRPIKAWLESL